MNDCPSADEILHLMKGRLEPTAGQEIVKHLSRCDRCRRLADELTDDSTVRQLHQQHARVSDLATPGSLVDLCEKLYELSQPALAPATDDGHIVGRYRLGQVLGKGAFGVVYRAEDTQLQRPVALKLPRTSTLADPDSQRRFFREARAVAGLHHPQIVALYDAGEWKGVGYLASAYTPGPTLGEWAAAQASIPARDAAQIVLALALAVQHAHANGVLHRDIKPQNVLLDPTAQFEDLAFSPKLTDFGVAKLISEADATMSGMLLGTPRYMAPEQLSGQRELLGPAGDIYSLGVVLYELLTGVLPIQGESQAEIIRRVCTEEPVAPRRLRADVPRDLEAICLTCLEKEPRRRYPTAGDLADDLLRFLQQRPTVARPLSVVERTARWMKRRPATAGIVGILLLATAIILAVLWRHNAQLGQLNTELGNTNRALGTALAAAERAGQRAVRSEAATQDLLYASDMRLAGRAWQAGDLRELSELLHRHLAAPGAPDRRGLEWRFLWQWIDLKPQLVDRQPSNIYFLTQWPQGWLATAGKDAIIRIYDSSSGPLRQSIPTGQREVNGLDITSDGRRMASAGDDGTICIWDLKDAKPVLRFSAHPSLVYQVCFTPDDKVLYSCGSDPIIRRWDAATGEKLGQLEGHDSNVEAITLSPDGGWLASAGKSGRVLVWNLSDPLPRYEFLADVPNTRFLCVAFSPDGTILAAGDESNVVWLWSMETGDCVAKTRHFDAVHSMTFAPDGKLLASGDRAGVVCYWDLAPLRNQSSSDPATQTDLSPLRQWPAHESHVNGILFDKAGQVVTVGTDGCVRRWNVPATTTVSAANVELDYTTAAVVTQDGRLIAVDSEHRLVSWNLQEDPQLKRPRSHEVPCAFLAIDRQERVLASCSRDGVVKIWDLSRPGESTPLLGSVIAGWQAEEAEDVRGICLGPDGSWLAVLTCRPSQVIACFETSSGRLLRRLEIGNGAVRQVVVSPDGKQVVTFADDDLLIWTPDLESPTASTPAAPSLLRIPRAHRWVHGIAFSPDGQLLATGGADRLVRFWNARDGSLVATLSGHRGIVETVLFSHDGRTLITGSHDGICKLWSVTARQELFDLYRNDIPIWQTTLSADERWLSLSLETRGIALIDLGRRLTSAGDQSSAEWGLSSP